MSIEQEDLDFIYDKLKSRFTEHSLRVLPEVVSQLFQERTVMAEMVKKFFDANPSYKALTNGTLQQVIEKVEGVNPGKPYNEILDIAKVELDKIIANINKVNMEVKKPDLAKRVDIGDLGEL